MKCWRAFHSNGVWPPLWLLVLFAGVYGIFEVFLWFIENAVPNGHEVMLDLPELTTIRSIILGSAAASYALFRLGRFHPACNHGYAAWLKSSPWTPDKPLPFGPLHLVWQDFVVISAITLVAIWPSHADAALPAMVFGLVYLAGMTALLAFTRMWRSCLVLALLWPTLFLPETKGWPLASVVVALSLAVWHGHRSSLRAFPWHFIGDFEARNSSSGNTFLHRELRIPALEGVTIQTIQTSSSAGWPYRALSPKIPFEPISPATTVWISVLIGWWTFCAIAGRQTSPMPELLLFIAIIAAVLRVAIYCSGIAPPFNLLGRLSTGRIVVPGFDKVFLTPLALIITGAIGGAVIRRSSLWHPVTECIVITMMSLLLLGGRPTLRSWRLTGQHRYRPPARARTNRPFLRPV